MNARAKSITQAVKIARERDGRCLECGAKEGLTGSHLLKRNSPFRRNDPTDPEFIFGQCMRCHYRFEPLSPEKRIAYLEQIGLDDLADKLRWLTDCTRGTR